MIFSCHCGSLHIRCYHPKRIIYEIYHTKYFVRLFFFYACYIFYQSQLAEALYCTSLWKSVCYGTYLGTNTWIPENNNELAAGLKRIIKTRIYLWSSVKILHEDDEAAVRRNLARMICDFINKLLWKHERNCEAHKFGKVTLTLQHALYIY
jgi:hypothetical protein